MAFDDWLFSGDSHIILRAEKATGHFQARHSKNTKFLAFWRITCLIYFLVLETYYWVPRAGEGGTSPFLYMTNWGHYFYALFNLLTVSGYISHVAVGLPVPEDSASPWLLWKHCSWLFNLLITLQFWIVLLWWVLWTFLSTEERQS